MDPTTLSAAYVRGVSSMLRLENADRPSPLWSRCRSCRRTGQPREDPFVSVVPFPSCRPMRSLHRSAFPLGAGRLNALGAGPFRRRGTGKQRTRTPRAKGAGHAEIRVDRQAGPQVRAHQGHPEAARDVDEEGWPRRSARGPSTRSARNEGSRRPRRARPCGTCRRHGGEGCGPGPTRPTGRTREQLAKQMGIEGRSKMNKEQLQRAPWTGRSGSGRPRRSGPALQDPAGHQRDEQHGGEDGEPLRPTGLRLDRTHRLDDLALGGAGASGESPPAFPATSVTLPAAAPPFSTALPTVPPMVSPTVSRTSTSFSASCSVLSPIARPPRIV
jgi:hypothetical protein